MGRIRTYVGPKTQVTPDEISVYERKSGVWAAEEKRDGCWAEVKIDSTGRIKSLTSRVGKAFTGDSVQGLLGLHTHLKDSTLAVELEAASEAATDRYRAIGYRRIHIFDAPVLGGIDLTGFEYEIRRKAIEQFVPSPFEEVAKRLLIVRQVQSDFQAFYNSVMRDGGEGLVFKKRSSLYRPTTSDGKVEAWIRCKPYSFVDYIVLSVGKSEGGSENLRVGLNMNGKISECCTIKNLPHGTNPHALVGKVIECKGAEVMKSGALRHGHFCRIRDDKLPEDCVWV